MLLILVRESDVAEQHSQFSPGSDHNDHIFAIRQLLEMSRIVAWHLV